MSVIDVRNLYKQYRNHVAVQDVSLSIERGEIFGIIGPNGAGKTTTVECIEGLRQPDRGSIAVLGLDPKRDQRILRQKVGVQTQASALPDKLKVWEALDLFSAFYAKPADWRMLLDRLGLREKQHATMDQLSGGQRQRVSLALALVGQPEIAVLDELTTGLDPQARRDVWHLIEQTRAMGVTVLLVTHFMEEAQYLCDRVAVINAGRVVAIDTPTGLIASACPEQHVQFRAVEPFDDSLLTQLPQVTSLKRAGTRIRVTGADNLLYRVTTTLAQHNIAAEDLQLEQATLDDAFAVLTGVRKEVRA